MGQIEVTLVDTLVIITALGVPVAILFLIGYLIRRMQLNGGKGK